MLAKTLTAFGLLLEFLSVFLIVYRNLFLDYRSEVSTWGLGVRHDICKKKKEAWIAILFLGYGMYLQVLALFIS